MYRYVCVSSRFMQLHSVTSYIVQNHAFSLDHAVRKSKLYDLTNYEFPFNSEEKESILNVLNSSSETDLYYYNITKRVAKKIIVNRSQNGKFQDISQLLNISGFGLKIVEKICEKMLVAPEYTSDEELLVKIFKRKSLVKPKFSSLNIPEMETFMALDLRISNLSWTRFNMRGEVLDIGTVDLFDSHDRIDEPKLQKKVREAVEKIPSANFYVWEEKANNGHLNNRSSFGSIVAALKFAQIRGALTALLNAVKGDDHEKLYYLKDSLMPKLFNLRVGEERISSSKIADDLMCRKKVFGWLPILTVDDEIENKFLLLEKIDKKPISNSLLVGLAFYETVISENIETYRILFN